MNVNYSLLSATFTGHDKGVKKMIRARTPLMAAARNGNIEYRKLLFQARAKLIISLTNRTWYQNWGLLNTVSV